MRRITRLAAIVAFAGAAAAPVAAQVGTVPPSSCSSWAASLSRQIAFFGIAGGQADSYVSPRHAGDPS